MLAHSHTATRSSISTRYMTETNPVVGGGPKQPVNVPVDMEIDPRTSILPTLPTTSLLPYTELVHEAVVQVSKEIHASFGPNCSESLYQRGVLRGLYLQNLPAMQERDIFTDYGQGSLLIGRVDLEVAGCCLYEFKSGKVNIAEHSNQLKRYLRAYANNNETIRVAALMYFTQTGVFVHRVL